MKEPSISGVGCQSAIPFVLLFACLSTAAAEPSNPAGADLFALAGLENQAIRHDPRLIAARATRQAREADVISAGSHPDPVVRLGLNNLPIDSFALDQEPMTQVQVTARQQLVTPGERRVLQAQKQAGVGIAQAGILEIEASVLREVRNIWLDGWKLQAFRELLKQKIVLLDKQEDALAAGYRSGETGRSAIARIEVRSAMLKERLTSIEGKLSAIRAELSRWDIHAPVLRWPASLPEILASTPNTPWQESAPQLAQARSQLERARQDVAVARQAYQPDWGVDAGYGYREDRVDFFTVGISVSVPLFPAKRQDQQLTSRQKTQEAARATLMNLRQEINASMAALGARLETAEQRLELYQNQILPAQRSLVSLLLAEVQTGKSGLAPLYEAQLRLIELKLEALTIKAEKARQIIEIRYLAGGNV